ncbi:MAG: LysR family transcriptional regulator [Oceanospirillaceae bacterium]|jgi:DNA-binding transcriptional LysR family regulator|nr:LysR family transcriptional regulator [Oceanospirillaceae bacterium]MBT4443185.1 LysR family transcriptional regulator [Oceanospirillaceae bacterium]MBT6078075.1 LysR family transcriptional regulator [Oceanospirillaceae bacterium]MBT7330712.1 LysR family transcriptional regulator [Oceanospirillaceae bacterium]
MKNIPTELLRTFVTIVNLGGFTQAGDVLGRSQPAISLQVKRLEELLNCRLFQRNNGLQVTEDGEILLDFAQRILDLNDTAVARLSKSQVSGQVRLGIPNDFEVSFLPRLLSHFGQTHPDVALEVNCDLSVKLLQDFQQGRYDLVLATDSLDDSHPQSQSGDEFHEIIVWVTNGHFEWPNNQPIPLVVYPTGCRYRKQIINKLNAAGIAWRIAYSSSSLLGIQAAIEAGLGISALARSTVPQSLHSHMELHECPQLGHVKLVFKHDRNNQSDATKRLYEYLHAGLEQSAS